MSKQQAPDRIWAFHAPELAEDNCGGNILAHAAFAYGGHEYLAREGETVRGLIEALRSVIDFAERQICTHDETHRAEFVWEICNQCGAEWADDEGGKPEFKWPEEIIKARAALAAMVGE